MTTALEKEYAISREMLRTEESKYRGACDLLRWIRLMINQRMFDEGTTIEEITIFLIQGKGEK